MAVLVDWSWTICLYFNRWCSDYFLDWLTDLSEGKIWARPLHHLDTNTLRQIFHGNWHDPCIPRLYYPGSHLNLFTFKIRQGLNKKYLYLSSWVESFDLSVHCAGLSRPLDLNLPCVPWRIPSLREGLINNRTVTILSVFPYHHGVLHKCLNEWSESFHEGSIGHSCYNQIYRLWVCSTHSFNGVLVQKPQDIDQRVEIKGDWPGK